MDRPRHGDFFHFEKVEFFFFTFFIRSQLHCSHHMFQLINSRGSNVSLLPIRLIALNGQSINRPAGPGTKKRGFLFFFSKPSLYFPAQGEILFALLSSFLFRVNAHPISCKHTFFLGTRVLKKRREKRNLRLKPGDGKGIGMPPTPKLKPN